MKTLSRPQELFSMIARIALTRYTEFSLIRLVDAIRARVPAETGVSSPTQKEGRIQFTVGDSDLELVAVGKPASLKRLDQLLAVSREGELDGEKIRRHQAHLAIRVSGNAPPRQRATDLTRVVAALLEQLDTAVAIYWKPAEHLLSPRRFVQLASEREQRPRIWVRVETSKSRTAGTSRGFTLGMSDLGFREIETDSATETPELLQRRLRGLVQFLLDQGAVLHDGESFGQTEHEKIRVRYRPDSVLGLPGPVMRLEYDSTRPAASAALGDQSLPSSGPAKRSRRWWAAALAVAMILLIGGGLTVYGLWARGVAQANRGTGEDRPVDADARQRLRDAERLLNQAGARSHGNSPNAERIAESLAGMFELRIEQMREESPRAWLDKLQPPFAFHCELHSNSLAVLCRIPTYFELEEPAREELEANLWQIVREQARVLNRQQAAVGILGNRSQSLALAGPREREAAPEAAGRDTLVAFFDPSGFSTPADRPPAVDEPASRQAGNLLGGSVAPPNPSETEGGPPSSAPRIPGPLDAPPPRRWDEAPLIEPGQPGRAFPQEARRFPGANRPPPGGRPVFPSIPAETITGPPPSYRVAVGDRHHYLGELRLQPAGMVTEVFLDLRYEAQSSTVVRYTGTTLRTDRSGEAEPPTESADVHQGTLIFDPSGKIRRGTRPGYLPRVGLPISTLVFPELSGSNRKNWTSEIRARGWGQNSDGSFRIQLPGMEATPGGTGKAARELLGNSEFKIVEENPDRLVIAIDSTWNAVGANADGWKLNWEGSAVFDRERNMVLSLSVEGTLTEPASSGATVIPVSLHLQWTPAEALEQLRRETRGDSDAPGAIPQEGSEGPSPSDSSWSPEQLKTRLGSDQIMELHRVIREMEVDPPSPPSDQQAEVVIDFLTRKPANLQVTSNWLAKWIPSTSYDRLVEALPAITDGITFGNALPLVTHHPEFPQQLLAALEVPALRSRARTEIGRLGPSAESEIAAALRGGESGGDSRLLIAWLGEHGSRRSLTALRSLARKTKDRQLQQLAETAIESIKERQ